MAKSINRLMAELVTATGDVDNSALGSVNLLDSADVLSIGNSSASGTAVFDTLDSLPTSNLSEGQQAFVNANQRLYISNGSGWYNLTFVNKTPTWLTEPDATYSIVDSATPLIVTAKATDSDNSDINLLNQSVATDSAQYMVSISNDSSVWTFTPKSADSIGIEVAAGNLTDSNGDFVYTFKWSDGINFVSKAVTITYNVVASGFPWSGDRALWITGNNEYNGPYAREIEYNDITTLGNSSDFANLAIQRAQYGAAAGSSTYYLVGGGRNSTSGRINNIDRGVVATLTDATDFGDLTQARNANGALSNGVRALWGGGYTGSAYSNTIDYVTVDTPSNAQDFGDFNAGTANLSTAGTADDTRGVFAGSIGSNQSNVIEYVTIATTGNAQDFGDLTHDGYGMAGVSDGTYGFFTGDADNIERITIQSPGNATDFGSLTTASRRFLGAAANTTRAVQAGGSTSTDPGETMEYFTMATGNDATSFGNLSEAKTYVSGHSGNAA